MADIHHGTLVANVVTTEVIDPYMVQITVQVRNSSKNEIYFTLDGVNPTVGGADTYVCDGVTVVPVPYYSVPTTVKMISLSAAEYTVKGETMV